MEKTVAVKKSKLETVLDDQREFKTRIMKCLDSHASRFRSIVTEISSNNSEQLLEIEGLKREILEKNKIIKQLRSKPITMKDINTDLYGIGIKQLVSVRDIKNCIFYFLKSEERRMLFRALFRVHTKYEVCCVCGDYPEVSHLRSNSCVLCKNKICTVSRKFCSTKYIINISDSYSSKELVIICRNCDKVHSIPSLTRKDLRTFIMEKIGNKEKKD